MTAMVDSHPDEILLMITLYSPRKEKKRLDYTFRRYFNEKPSIIGCPDYSHSFTDR